MKTNYIIMIAFVAVITVMAISCFRENSLNNPLPPDVALNPSFARHPPAVKKCYVQKIKGDGKHVLMLAEIDSLSFKEPFLAVMYGDKKLIFRNDGRGVDKTAYDGLYTAPIDISPDMVSKKMAAIDTSASPSFRFVGRSKVPDIAMLRAAGPDFEKGELVEIDFPLSDCLINQERIINHCLMVTNLNVIQDGKYTYNAGSPATFKGNPDGAWTFWHLMQRLIQSDASDVVTDAEVSSFIINWLQTFFNPQNVNSFAVDRRETVTTRGTVNVNTLIIDPWLSLSGGSTLKPEYCPFRLLAIVNRIDLHESVSYRSINETINAGELRFVFCHNASGAAGIGPIDVTNQFLVIFEYGVRAGKSCIGLKNYAREWNNLYDLSLTSQDYRDKLAELTEKYTTPGIHSSKPNGNPLNQIRTNEVALELPWQMREYNLNTSSGVQLILTTTKNEPARAFNQKNITPETKTLAKYINEHESAILLGYDSIPDDFDGVDFLSGSAVAPAPRTPTTQSFPCNFFPGIEKVYWDAFSTYLTAPSDEYKINNPEARHLFSLNTCSGCHNGETETEFAHVKPARFNDETPLSAFLTGDYAGAIKKIGTTDCDWNLDAYEEGVEDPSEYLAVIPPGTVRTRRTFSDLQRRSIVFCKLINMDCSDPFGLAKMLTHYIPPVE